MELVVSELTGYGISADGGDAVLYLRTADDRTASLRIGTPELERVVQELGQVVTKVRELSELSKQNLIALVQPSKARANLASDGLTIVISLQIRNSLEIHYGFERNHALALAAQMTAAAERGMKSTSPGH
jgi:hypothetical protein